MEKQREVEVAGLKGKLAATETEKVAVQNVLDSMKEKHRREIKGRDAAARKEHNLARPSLAREYDAVLAVTSFTPKRVRKALRIVCPDFEGGVETDSDSGSDGPAPCDDPAEETNVRFPKGKGIDLGDIDFSVDDSILLGWDPDLAYGDGSGTSEAPIPDFDDFFAGLPSSFDSPSSVDEMGRSKIVAEGSRIIDGALAEYIEGGFELEEELEHLRDRGISLDLDYGLALVSDPSLSLLELPEVSGDSVDQE
ncbi:hypothetical protein Bca52824_071264 [Brassica carinata]|uniref:Uncharacterized protein n=1 Tax=Brassica carinata TaxID=52824 RepID=A0A8X7Q5Z0_BRACI|nr:hypothetical protein Bca52824_071264 [Brassica carinata]